MTLRRLRLRTQVRVRTLLQHLTGARSRHSAYLEGVSGFLECVNGFHRGHIENSVNRACVKTAVLDDPLDAFDRDRAVRFIQFPVQPCDQLADESFCPRRLAAAFQRLLRRGRGLGKLSGLGRSRRQPLFRLMFDPW